MIPGGARSTMRMSVGTGGECGFCGCLRRWCSAFCGVAVSGCECSMERGAVFYVWSEQ